MTDHVHDYMYLIEPPTAARPTVLVKRFCQCGKFSIIEIKDECEWK